MLITTAPGRPGTSTAPSYLPASDKRSLSLGWWDALCCRRYSLAALAKPQWVLTFSAFFHVVRLFGGTAGAIYMGHFIAEREKLHSNLLGLHVSSGNWITDQNIHAMTAGLYAKSSGMAAASARAVDLIAARLRLQAYSLSLIDGFLLIAWSCACRLDLCRFAAQITVELRRPERHATDS